jgi:cysteine synthase A
MLDAVNVRPALAESVLDLVGNTPLVRLNRTGGPECATIYGKLESLNPAGSVKDRIAVAMVCEAERSGRLQAGATIVEPTSGNTGIGLAMVAAVKGYRRKLLQRFGAELLLTPAIEGMSGAVFAAEELIREHPDYFMPQQFSNPANPEVHRLTTGPEILRALDGQIDAFVAGVGTGGTITGVGEVLRRHNADVLIVAVEPARSQVLRGRRWGPHAIQGIGASFVPGVLNRSIYDEIIPVQDDDAIETASRLARQEGLLVGISSGANVFAAAKIAKRLGPGKTVVTMLCDTGERYLSAPP